MPPRPELPVKLYYRIGEVAEVVGVEPHVLRYWESEFGSIRPQKSPKGQRVYSRRDLEKLLRVKELLYDEGYTIAGAKKRLREGSADGRRASASSASAAEAITSSGPVAEAVANTSEAALPSAPVAEVSATPSVRGAPLEPVVWGERARSSAPPSARSPSPPERSSSPERVVARAPSVAEGAASEPVIPPGALGVHARRELAALRELIRAELLLLDEPE